ncbi:hypothetical protein BDY21DRAFT_281425 [Lineolata rhizophorae]|uniref:Uncharacterized protein n=1 Tax=Lineolata rhizophorae TaxID=578093 RepID=A0A6A6P6Y0_9PEZI|nr:hypothetical protein BDY21DRAFT_281425 [Lineolata rhizophorae]
MRPPPAPTGIEAHIRSSPPVGAARSDGSDGRGAGAANGQSEKGRGSTGEDPADPIEQADWEDLYDQFKEKMEEHYTNEVQLHEEFVALMKFFKSWSETGQSVEAERASKRLRRRMSYVEAAEDDLEGKRQHYIKVVRAFESALNLLNST